jgi:hypothetical protein
MTLCVGKTVMTNTDIFVLPKGPGASWSLMYFAGRDIFVLPKKSFSETVLVGILSLVETRKVYHPLGLRTTSWTWLN